MKKSFYYIDELVRCMYKGSIRVGRVVSSEDNTKVDMAKTQVKIDHEYLTFLTVDVERVD